MIAKIQCNVFKFVCDWLRDKKNEQYLFIFDNIDVFRFFLEINNVNQKMWKICDRD